MTARWFGGLSVALALVACGPERVPPPQSPAPSAPSPGAVIPGDLDVAVRFDLARMREALGDDTLRRLRARAAEGSGAEPELSRLLGDLLLRSQTLWVAFRPGPRADRVDNVIVLRGRFADVDLRSYDLSPSFGPPADLGAGWRRWDRLAADGRAEPARAYAQGDDLLVLVSIAEVDAVERQLEGGAGDEHVEPKEKGVISFAARGPALARAVEDRSLRLSRLLALAKTLRGHADLGAGGLDAELELDVEDEASATDLDGELERLLAAFATQGPLAAELARGVRVDAVASRLVVRVSLPPEPLARLLGAAP